MVSRSADTRWWIVGRHDPSRPASKTFPTLCGADTAAHKTPARSADTSRSPLFRPTLSGVQVLRRRDQPVWVILKLPKRQITNPTEKPTQRAGGVTVIKKEHCSAGTWVGRPADRAPTSLRRHESLVILRG